MSYRRTNESSPLEVEPSTAGASGGGDHAQTSDLFGGHEFAYESHTDLFRCIKCHRYEVTVRKKDDDTIEPCDGIPPAGSGPIEVNMF